MFNIGYINQLITGQLSNEGYKHFISAISFFVRKYNWPKAIVVSNETKVSKYWSIDEIRELAHQFFEWTISKGKLDNLNKIPESYLSYYFLQILISFVATRIKEEQQKEGLSFEKCRELVLSICKEEYIIDSIDGKEFVYSKQFSKDDLKSNEDIENAIAYLSKIPIRESTKHFRPIVNLAIEDILSAIESPINLNKLTETVFSLFDQRSFNTISISEQSTIIESAQTHQKYDMVIRKLVIGLTKEDARILFDYLFENNGEQSLIEMADKYKIPKSTFHHKVNSFKKKIVSSYIPENEQDGILFIQYISSALDKLSN